MPGATVHVPPYRARRARTAWRGARATRARPAVQREGSRWTRCRGRGSRPRCRIASAASRQRASACRTVVREVAATRDDVRLRSCRIGEQPRPAKRSKSGMSTCPVDEADHCPLLRAPGEPHVVRTGTGRRRREIRGPGRRPRRGGRCRGDREHHGRRRCEQRGPHQAERLTGSCGPMQREPSRQPVRTRLPRPRSHAPSRAVAPNARPCEYPPPIHYVGVFSPGREKSTTLRRCLTRWPIRSCLATRDTMSRRERLPLSDHRPRLAPAAAGRSLAVLGRIRGGRYLRPLVTWLAKLPLLRRGIKKASMAQLERENPELARAVRKIEAFGTPKTPEQAQRALALLTPAERRAYLAAVSDQTEMPEPTNRAARRTRVPAGRDADASPRGPQKASLT